MAENIQMSQYGFQFLSEIEQHLAVDGCDPPDVQLHCQGYLFLASKEGEERMKENHVTQRWIFKVIVLRFEHLFKKGKMVNPLNPRHLISLHSNTAELFTNIIRIKEMIT